MSAGDRRGMENLDTCLYDLECGLDGLTFSNVFYV